MKKEIILALMFILISSLPISSSLAEKSSASNGLTITKNAEGKTVITKKIYSQQFIDPAVKKSRALYEPPQVSFMLNGYARRHPVLATTTIVIDPTSPRILAEAAKYYFQHGTNEGFENSDSFYNAALNSDFNVKIDLENGVNLNRLYGPSIAEGLVIDSILKPWKDAGLLTYIRNEKGIENGYFELTGGTKEAQEAASKLIKHIYPTWNNKGNNRLGYPDSNIRALELTGTAPSMFGMLTGEGSAISLTTADKTGKSKQAFVLSTSNPVQNQLVAGLSNGVIKNLAQDGEPKQQQLAQTPLTPSIKQKEIPVSKEPANKEPSSAEGDSWWPDWQDFLDFLNPQSETKTPSQPDRPVEDILPEEEMNLPEVVRAIPVEQSIPTTTPDKSIYDSKGNLISDSSGLTYSGKKAAFGNNIDDSKTKYVPGKNRESSKKYFFDKNGKELGYYDFKDKKYHKTEPSSNAPKPVSNAFTPITPTGPYPGEEEEDTGL